MSNQNKYYRGLGYHVDRDLAEEFVEKHIDENGEFVDTNTEEFKADLKAFIEGHARVEEAYITPNTNSMFAQVDGDCWLSSEITDELYQQLKPKFEVV